MREEKGEAPQGMDHAVVAGGMDGAKAMVKLGRMAFGSYARELYW